MPRAQEPNSRGAQRHSTPTPLVDPRFIADVARAMPPATQTFPLYGDAAIPNSKPGPNEEKAGEWGFLTKVSRPTIEVYLPGQSRANGESVLIFPGGGYEGLSMQQEGTLVAQFFQDHGIAAFIVKYRLPSDSTMENKSIGP